METSECLKLPKIAGFLETSEADLTPSILRFAQDFGSGLPMRSHPLNASSYQRALVAKWGGVASGPSC